MLNNFAQHSLLTMGSIIAVASEDVLSELVVHVLFSRGAADVFVDGPSFSSTEFAIPVDARNKDGRVTAYRHRGQLSVHFPAGLMNHLLLQFHPAWT